MRSVEDRVGDKFVITVCGLALLTGSVILGVKAVENAGKFKASFSSSDVLPPVPGMPEPLPTKIPITITPAKIPSSLELSSFLKRNDCSLKPGLAIAGLPVTGLPLIDELTIVCTKPLNGQAHRKMRERVAKAYGPFREITIDNSTRRFKHRFQRIAGK